MRLLPAALCLLLLCAVPARAEEVSLYAAGSLKEALTALAADFTARTGIAVRTAFGPSGLMREKIEAGEEADLFASADMGQAEALLKGGRAAAVVMFTRNRLCAFATPAAGLTRENFAARLANPAVLLGTSTPKADPAGDYTWEMFRRIDAGHPGAFAILSAKARQLVGGSTKVDPANPNPVASAFARGEINVMIAYCSGAAQQRKAVPELEVVEIPRALAGGPEYGLAITRFDRPPAVALAFAILSPAGQAVLERFGFSPVALPATP